MLLVCLYVTITDEDFGPLCTIQNIGHTFPHNLIRITVTRFGFKSVC